MLTLIKPPDINIFINSDKNLFILRIQYQDHAFTLCLIFKNGGIFGWHKCVLSFRYSHRVQRGQQKDI